jgi:hypothetical protein
MIDRRARNRLAEEIRHFVAGLTDNFTFDDRVFNIRTKDSGVLTIRDEMWHIYDDFSRHKQKGKWSLTIQYKAVAARCILFLKTNLEYRWPPKQSLFQSLIRMLTFGLTSNFLEENWKSTGSLKVWPFFTIEEFEAANINPPYLNKCK